LCGNVNVGDDACAAGFSFSFGADGKADLVAMVTEVGSSGGIFFQFSDQRFQVFFERAVFFSQGFEFPFKKRSGQHIITHAGGL